MTYTYIAKVVIGGIAAVVIGYFIFSFLGSFVLHQSADPIIKYRMETTETNAAILDTLQINDTFDFSAFKGKLEDKYIEEKEPMFTVYVVTTEFNITTSNKKARITVDNKTKKVLHFEIM